MNKIDELIKEFCPNGVEFLEIDSLCKTISAKIKVKSLDYMKSGKYPIIDQGQNFISGYTNEDSPFPLDEYVIFGDHTCIVKYVDFPFIQGADGVKVLVANKNIIITKYLFYCMSNIHIDVDYSRHWSKMKKKLIPVPPFEIQQKIAEILSTQDKVIELLEKQLEQEKLKKKALMKLMILEK